MPLAVGGFLLACAVVGFGITCLSGIGLTLEERIVYGSVLGAMTVTATTFLVSLVVRDVTLVTVLEGLGLALVIAVAGALAGRPQIVADGADARTRWIAPLRSPNHPWPLVVVFVICGAWTVHFLSQAYVYTDGGVLAGYVNIWGDWAAHLAYAGSFAYGHNFPPEFPIDPGHHLGYPFMIDFFAADLVPLGASLTEALTATTAMLGLALPAVLYLAAHRFVGSRVAAAIAVFVFLLSGGLGFVYLLSDVQRFGAGALQHLQREYTLDRVVDLQWLNPVLAYLVPQRSTLFGFSLALIVLVVLWVAIRQNLSWRPFLFAGIVAAVMPIFHVHAYGTVVALGAFWALFTTRSQWLAYFGPAFAIGIPILIWMWPPNNTSACGGPAGLCVQIGWLSTGDLFRDGPVVDEAQWLWFWLWNTSLLLPLMLIAHIVLRQSPAAFPNWIAPIWLWFAIPNLVVLQPWIWDNTKFFVFWALFGSVLVGALLARMFRGGVLPAIAAAIAVVVLCLSGALDLARASDPTVSAFLFTDQGGLKVAAWVRDNTPSDSLFVAADEHNSPISTLGGRRVLVGYPGWLWTYGLADYAQKETDDYSILSGDPSALTLVKKYGIDYVLIGPQEIPHGASRAYWDEHGTRVYDDGEYTVYRVGDA